MWNDLVAVLVLVGTFMALVSFLNFDASEEDDDEY